MTKGLMSEIVDKRLSVIITKCIIKRKKKRKYINQMQMFRCMRTFEALFPLYD